ncbi:hypothetical protein [Paenibacillus herberti]|uniref:Uncharacterized protein n=1 Tax=Paenibacillus herberti TaxID=1619309 RepID=A0A229NVU5_9BACL|nr:hypothetical protein [Paenibacillus herberti]OXM13759.1 hypothetical protein CGZ75_22355 [Paenibacillus herberti]
MKKVIGLAVAACLLMVVVMIGILHPAYAPSPALVLGNEEIQGAAVQPVPFAEIAYIDEAPPAEAAGNPVAMDFSKVNGVSLDDGKEQVVTNIGIPDSSSKDELFEEQTVWSYADMKVGFIENKVDYVSIPKDAKVVELHGTKLPITVEGWTEKFGEPMFKAEDGVGYVDPRGFAAKLFFKEGTNQVVSVDFFWADQQ